MIIIIMIMIMIMIYLYIKRQQTHSRCDIQGYIVLEKERVFWGGVGAVGGRSLKSRTT
jgi:hypothetical protein